MVRVVDNYRNTNYELVYLGVDKDTLRIAYREYTDKNLARASFFQDLTYKVSDKKIRFKNLEMIIAEANNEHIKLTIIEDGIQRYKGGYGNWSK
jgi:hypothetical protein